MLDEYFKTTNYNKLKITKEQGNLIEKDFELVKGSDFHKNYYEMNDKNRELEEKILQMETSSQNQINAMRRLSNVGNKLTRGRRRISRSNRHRSLSREQGVNIGRHLLQSSA